MSFIQIATGHKSQETFLASRDIQKLSNNPLLEVMSLHGQMGPCLITKLFS
jgi:hypothetical protein